MPDPDENDRKRLRERLQELGPESVKRLMAIGGFPTNRWLEIEKWLSEEEASAAKSRRKSAAKPRRKPSPSSLPPRPSSLPPRRRRRRYRFAPVFREMTEMVERDGLNALMDLSVDDMVERFKPAHVDVCREARNKVQRRFRKRQSQS